MFHDSCTMLKTELKVLQDNGNERNLNLKQILDGILELQQRLNLLKTGESADTIN
jgi:hypothetical protein